MIGKGQSILDDYTRLKGEESKDLLKELFLIILTGSISPAMVEFLNKDLYPQGIKSLTEFIDEQFPTLIKGFTCLLSAAKLVQMVAYSFHDEFAELESVTR